MVSLLLEVREGCILTAACAPHGSEAETDPRREESLLPVVGLREGLCAGEFSVLLSALWLMSVLMLMVGCCATVFQQGITGDVRDKS